MRKPQYVRHEPYFDNTVLYQIVSKKKKLYPIYPTLLNHVFKAVNIPCFIMLPLVFLFYVKKVMLKETVRKAQVGLKGTRHYW